MNISTRVQVGVSQVFSAITVAIMGKPKKFELVCIIP